MFAIFLDWTMKIGNFTSALTHTVLVPTHHLLGEVGASLRLEGK